MLYRLFLICSVAVTFNGAQKTFSFRGDDNFPEIDALDDLQGKLL